MLTFVEEILLLSHDEAEGRFLDLPEELASTAMVGAVLMDLALLNRIDTDLDQLFVVDPTPTGEPLLDRVLEHFAAAGAPRATSRWLEQLRPLGPELQRQALARLIERGILRQENRRVLWVFSTRRYPLIDDRQQQEVKLRIRSLLGSDEIPDPRDVMIIALADAMGLLAHIFPEPLLRTTELRLRRIVRLDLIGHAVRSVIEGLQASLLDSAKYASLP